LFVFFKIKFIKNAPLRLLTLLCLRSGRKHDVVTNTEVCHRFSSLETSTIELRAYPIYKKRVLSMTPMYCPYE